MARRLGSNRASRVATQWCVLAAVGAGLLSACSSAESACAGPAATIPSSAHPGQTIKVPLENLTSDCYDQGEGLANPVADTVTVTLFDGATQETVATATAPVDADARAVVNLKVPADAMGSLVIVYDGVTMGAVTIVPAA